MNNKKDKKVLADFILDELNITYNRSSVLNKVLLKKLSHKDLSNIAITIYYNK